MTGRPLQGRPGSFISRACAPGYWRRHPRSRNFAAGAETPTMEFRRRRRFVQTRGPRPDRGGAPVTFEAVVDHEDMAPVGVDVDARLELAEGCRRRNPVSPVRSHDLGLPLPVKGDHCPQHPETPSAMARRRKSHYRLSLVPSPQKRVAHDFDAGRILLHPLPVAFLRKTGGVRHSRSSRATRAAGRAGDAGERTRRGRWLRPKLYSSEARTVGMA